MRTADSMFSSKTMNKYMERIRWFINDRRKQYILFKNRPAWAQLCSSLDVIGDSVLAIESYSALRLQSEPGPMYLVMYGLLQALVLQQEAVRNMCEALGFKEDIKKYPGLSEIREIRHDTAGHPTKTKPIKAKDRPEAYHHISRITLGPDGFQLLSHYRDGRSEMRYINIPKLLKDQEKYVSQILRKVIKHLEAEMATHKEKFRDENLVDCFPEVWGYHTEKMSEGTYKVDKAHAIWADASLLSIKEMLERFRKALARRGIELDTDDSVKYLYEDLEYPLAELEAFFEAVREGRNPNIDHRAAYIFTYYVRAKLGELREIAEEIDKDYAT